MARLDNFAAENGELHLLTGETALSHPRFDLDGCFQECSRPARRARIGMKTSSGAPHGAVARSLRPYTPPFSFSSRSRGICRFPSHPVPNFTPGFTAPWKSEPPVTRSEERRVGKE